MNFFLLCLIVLLSFTKYSLLFQDLEAVKHYCSHNLLLIRSHNLFLYILYLFFASFVLFLKAPIQYPFLVKKMPIQPLGKHGLSTCLCFFVCLS